MLAMTVRADSRFVRLAPTLVGAVALAVYLRTLLPGMAFGDWGEMQTVPHVLGIPHPTGYPTYVILSWFAQVVPVGSIAFRANLLSAVLVSAVVGVAVAILLRMGTRPVMAIAAALALGAVRSVWSAATVAEVNPLHLLFVALLLHRALAWEERRLPRDLIIGALLLGLALGNHLLTLFIAPSIAIFVVWVGRREIAAKPRILVPAAAAGIVGMLVYLYIPIAARLSPPLAYNHPVTFDGVWWLVSGYQFRDQFDFLSPDGPSEFMRSLPALWSLLVSQATPVLPILGLVGLVVLIRRRPAFGLMCAAILLTHLYVWANYLRLEHYLLAAWLILAIGAAVALDAIVQGFASVWSGSWRARAEALIGVAAVALAVALAVANWWVVDRSDDRSAEIYVDALFGALPPDAAILSQWDASTPLWHAQLVLGRRPDVLVVDDTNVVYDGWGSRERRIASMVCERPVFILRLDDRDLVPTRAAFRVEPFMAVRIAQGGPAATVDRQVFRVEPLDPAGCP
jgi:transmembrane protein TMEM260 (protein O-mannosyltransferase)